MSRKWNIFRKKNKADSHGTTAADEELQFQPVPPQHKEPARLSAKQSNQQVLSVGSTGSHSDEPGIHKDRFSRSSKRGKDTERKTQSNNKENHGENRITERVHNLTVEGERDGPEYNSLDRENIREKMLAKPPQMPGLLEPPRDFGTGGQGKDVSISDEYSDPFDALQQRAKARQGADGYTEPYKAQQMHQQIARGGANLPEEFDGNYHDPWDKKNDSIDYEDPWDSNKDATLPYAMKKKYSEGSVDTERFQRKLHNGKPHNNSLSSVASSTSSASPNTAARRLVRVEQPRTSPKSSPHFDRRLILPKDNYSEPWGNQSKFRPIDKRLIKAEPSLEELRRMSPSGNSSVGTGSPISSGRGSPDIGSATIARISPSTNSSIPPYLANMNRSKSRSLDMRNNKGALVALGRGKQFPKSASDDHLTSSACHCSNSSIPNQQLNGVGEYEEPWDKPSAPEQPQYHPVSHTRSRSYEMQGSPGNRRTRNEPPSQIGEDSMYEHPWDKNPADHMQSMQRFQQRKLELHPTEAINTRDFDPLRPLESQTWYHAGITRDEAEMRLRDKLQGSFLVRKSESLKDSYSLSVQSSKGCIHMLLRCTRDDSWILGEFSAPFLSAPEMVSYYTRNRLKISDSDYVMLSYPIADTSM